jgi:hypothetical protein
MDEKYIMTMTPELVGYISQLMAEEKDRVKNNELAPLILPIIDEWFRVELDVRGSVSADLLDNMSKSSIMEN